MSSYAKYITFDNGMFPDYVIFNGAREHVQMARDLNLRPEDIIGAGFVVIVGGKLHPYGGSTSLNKESADQDARILNKEFG